VEVLGIDLTTDVETLFDEEKGTSMGLVGYDMSKLCSDNVNN
jgi:hypothetical protein